MAWLQFQKYCSAISSIFENSFEKLVWKYDTWKTLEDYLKEVEKIF